MTSMNDEVLFATLIELADTTTTGFDLVSMADRLVGACVEVLGVTAAGIMLADQRQSLRVFASSNEESRILELLELQNNDGPCLEAFSTGAAIDGVDLSQFTTRWPHFAPAALSAGFRTAYAIPMRLRNQTIGALNLFQVAIEPMSDRDVSVARVLADMAAIGIINHWSLRQQEVLAQQLQSALNTRIIIEQAKGVVAERRRISLGEAFEFLRSTARSSQRPIADVAIEAVTGPVESAPPPEPGIATPGAGPAPHTPAGASLPPTAERPGPDGSTEPEPGAGVTAGAQGRAVDVIEPGLADNPEVVGVRTGAAEPEPRRAGQVERALEIVQLVYSVSPVDALDVFSEITQILNRSMLDLAIQVLAEGRLPEAAILETRRELRCTTREEPDRTQPAPPEKV